MANRTWTGAVSGNWGTAGNWLEASVPVTGDAVFLQNNAIAIDAGLNQSAVTLASLTIASTYTGLIATDSTYLQVGATAVTIGARSGGGGAANGSGRIMLDFGSVQTTVTVLATNRTPATSGYETVRLIGSHASNKLYVIGPASVGIATSLPSETATFTEVDVADAGATVNVGAGVTFATGNCTAGTLNVNCAATTLTTGAAGTINTANTGNVTTANCNGRMNFAGRPCTITTLNLYGTGTADFSGNPAAVTVTTLNYYGGALKWVAATPTHLTVTTFTRQAGLGSLTGAGT